ANLQMLGHGLFEKIEADKEPIWQSLLSDDKEVRFQAKSLVEQNESSIVETANSIAAKGQLQPVGVVDLGDGTYDVIFGMQRCIARAFNFADGKGPATVEARVYPKSVLKDKLTLKLRSRDENRVRKEESPIDRAMYYKELKKEHNLTD